VGTPTVFKAQCGNGGGGHTMVLEDVVGGMTPGRVKRLERYKECG
jgi:hypothetical protein